MKSIIQYLLKLFYPIFRSVLPFEVYAYLSVGAANTLFNIGLFVLFFFQFSYISFTQQFALEIATVLSFLITVASGFWLNKNFAFTNASNEKSASKKQFGKYFLVSLQGQVSDYVLTKFLVVVLIFHPTVAYLISTVIMLILTYFLQKYFTFRVEKQHTF